MQTLKAKELKTNIKKDTVTTIPMPIITKGELIQAKKSLIKRIKKKSLLSKGQFKLLI